MSATILGGTEYNRMLAGGFATGVCVAIVVCADMYPEAIAVNIVAPGENPVIFASVCV